jgi:hypothetical protein
VEKRQHGWSSQQRDAEYLPVDILRGQVTFLLSWIDSTLVGFLVVEPHPISHNISMHNSVL